MLRYKHIIAILRMRGDVDPALIWKVQYETKYDVFDSLVIYFKDDTKKEYGSIELLDIIAEFSIKSCPEYNHIANDL